MPRILCCECSCARVLPRRATEAVLAGLRAAGAGFHQVPIMQFSIAGPVVALLEVAAQMFTPR